MKRIVVPLLLATALGAGLYFFLPQSSGDVAADAESAGATGNARPESLQIRVGKLERAIADERQARQLLQEELVYLTSEVELLRDGGVTAPVEPDLPVARVEQADDPVPASRERAAGRNSAGYRAQRLVDAGFSPDRAEWILQREGAVRMTAMEARYEAQRSGERVDYGALRQAELESFRNDLGEQDYERYLEGTGRSTAVLIGSVLDTSPAQRVGLQPGDRIVSYGGERVYNMSDLNRAMLTGQAGDTVTAEVVRDGVAMQIAVRRGPLGITSGRAGRR